MAIAEKIEKVFCHEIPMFPQPEPTRNKGGDCFACAALAALRWLYPEREFTFDEIWEGFLLPHVRTETGEESSFLGNAWPHYSDVFDNLAKKLNLDSLSHRKNSCHPTFTDWGCDEGNWNRDHSQYRKYWDKLDEDLRCGGIVYISINMNGEGPWKNGRWNHTDHVVLIDGVREHTVPFEDWAATIYGEAHVVCSRDKGGWKTMHELLDLHGAGAWHVLERKK